MKNFNSLLELAAEYNTDLKCRAYLESKIWNGVPVCAHCGNEDVYRFKNGKLFKCKTCKKQFTVTVGTIFEGSHIQLQKWFMGIYLLTSHSKGISSLQLSKDLGITQKSAWYMMHRLRYALRERSLLNKKFEGVTEMDETFVGGWERNRHTKKKGLKEKKPVFGMICRSTKQVRTQVVNDVKKDTLVPIIEANVAKGTAIVTDDSNSYTSLRTQYPHFSVNHSIGEYVRNGNIHTNGIENFWSIFKRGFVGVYHQMSVKHLDKYLDEFEFRFNNKDEKAQSRMNLLLNQTSGYLSYKQLIGKK